MNRGRENKPEPGRFGRGPLEFSFRGEGEGEGKWTFRQDTVSSFSSSDIKVLTFFPSCELSGISHHDYVL